MSKLTDSLLSSIDSHIANIEKSNMRIDNKIGNFIDDISSQIGTLKDSLSNIVKETIKNISIDNETLSTQNQQTENILTSIDENISKQYELLKKQDDERNNGSKLEKSEFLKNFSVIIKFLRTVSPKKAKVVSEALVVLSKGIDKFAESIDKVDDKKVDSVNNFFSSFGKKIAMFTLLITVSAIPLALSSLIVLPTLMAWWYVIGKFADREKDFNSVGKAFKSIGIGIGLLALSVASYLFFVGGGNPLQAIGNSLGVAFAIGSLAMTFIFLSKFSKKINSASYSLGLMSISLFALTFSINTFYETFKDPSNLMLSTLTLSMSILALGGTFYLLGNFASNILKGSLSMLLASASIYVIATALVKFSEANFGIEDGLILSGTLIGIGGAMALVGFLGVNVILGSIAMLLTSFSLIILSSGLQSYKDTNFTLEDGLSLSAVIGALSLAMAGLGFASVFILGGSVAMMTTSIALMLFSKSLSFYKDVGWNDSDTKSLQNTLTSTITTFVGIFDEISFTQIGKAIAGTMLLGTLGANLSIFAMGLSAMASMQSPIYDVKDGKLVLVGTKPLSSDFAIKVAENIKSMISALIEPLSEFGANEGMIFSGDVGNGINLLGRLGNSLSEFAQGLQNFANFQVPIYDVKDGKLVLVGTKPISSDFTSKVATNIDMLINALIEPLSKLGANSGAIFDSDFEDGLDLLSELATPIKDIASAIDTFSKIGDGKVSGKQIADDISQLTQGLSIAFSEENFNSKSISNLSNFSDTFENLTESINDISTENATKVGEVFSKIQGSINGIDNEKLKKMNELMFNFKEFSLSLENSFDNIEAVLEKLTKMIQTINTNASLSSTSTVNNTTTNTASETNEKVQEKVQQDDTNTINLNEMLGTLEDIKNILNGTLDVKIDNISLLST